MVRRSLLLGLFVAAFAWADTGFYSTVQVTETDGVPKCQAGQIKFGAGQVSCSGQTATVTITGGGGGGGASGQVNNGNTYQTPYYSVAGSSNVLSATSNIQVFPSSVTIFGKTPVVSTGTLQSGTTIFVSSGTINTLNTTTLNVFDGTVSDFFEFQAPALVIFDPGVFVQFDSGISGDLVVGGNLDAATTSGSGLSSCGDSTHALAYSSGSGLFSCQSVTGSGGGAGYAMEPATVTVNLAKGFTASTGTVTGSDGFSTTYGITGGSVTVNDLTASLPVQTNSNKKLISLAIDGSGSQFTGTIAAARMPALTGDITTSAGAVATTAGALQSNIKTFSSTITVSNTGGIKTTGPIIGTTFTFISGGSYASQITSNTILGAATVYADGLIRGSNLTGSASGTNTGDQTITLTGDVTGSGTGSFATTMAPIQANMRTITSSLTVTGSLGLGVTYGVIAATITVSTITINSSATINNVDNLAFRDSHISSVGTSPALTSCGTSPSVTGGDMAFTITGGATASGCIATFAKPFGTAPTCSVSQQTMSLVNALSYSVASTAITISQVGLGTAKLDVTCFGHDN